MRARDTWRALLAIACALPGFAQEATETPSPDRTPVFIVEDGAPPGFENLDVPQSTLVDVSYGGRELAPARATFTEDTQPPALESFELDLSLNQLTPGKQV